MVKKVNATPTRSRKTPTNASPPAAAKESFADVEPGGGFVSIRMSNDLRRMVEIEAARDDRSQSKWIQRLVRAYFVRKYAAPLDNEGNLVDRGWTVPPDTGE